MGKKFKKDLRQSTKRARNAVIFIGGDFIRLRVIKGFNAEKVFHHKFEKSTSKFEQFSNKLMIKTQLAGPVSEILGIMVFCVLIWYGGNLVLIEKTISSSCFYSFSWSCIQYNYSGKINI